MSLPSTPHVPLALSRAHSRLLDERLGPLLAPVRSQIFGPQRFAEHGRSLAATHEVRPARWLDVRFFPRLRSNIGMLRQSHQVLLAQAGDGHELSPASQWLLDNFHLIDAQLLAIHDGLPRSYFRALPVLRDEPLAGLPRIYGVAWAFVAHTDSAFDEALLQAYLGAYLDKRELRLTEIWALPTTLRVVLVENLRRLAERLATHKAVRALANQCCDCIDRGESPALAALFDRVQRRGAGTVFLAQMGQRLQARASGAGAGEPAEVPADVAAWLETELPNLAAVQARLNAEQTADNLSVSNAVGALRAIGDADWPQIVAVVSPLMRLMLGSPLFAAEHHVTQDDTLHGIERVARKLGASEMRVGRALLSLIHQSAADEPAGAVAGHWLAGPGRPALRAALGSAPRWPWLARERWQALVLPAYLVTLAAGTAGLVAAVVPGGAFGGALGGVQPVWLSLLLLAAPASEAAIALLHRLIGESSRPHRLPRLALLDGIPPEHRVMVVMPVMLSDGDAIDGLVRQLALHHLANPEVNAQFALLTDWTDADAAEAGGDDGLLALAAQGVHALNERHAGGASRFVLLHRRRRYSRSERRWIGWERKRGKLEQLVGALVGAPDATADEAFLDLGPLSALAPGTRYLITLDSDTQLPPGRLRELVGVAAHPANRPRLSADGRRVVAGYGILQPHLSTPLPLPAEDTLFHRLFAGQSGIDPYSAVSGEIYQDLFQEASFAGKGLLDVHAMQAVLADRLPQDRVLSHDLLEGALVRCGAVTDVTLIEDAPFHAEVAASRVHRWTRGDWQLLPILLLSFWRPRRYPLGAVNRWKMADNLRRSLVPPAALALLVLALAGPATGARLGWAAWLPWAPPLLPSLALVLAAFAAGPLLGALAGLVPGRAAVARLHFYRLAALELLRAVAGGLWHLAMLLQHALLAVDAIVRALWRLAVSQRRLLQWTTAASAASGASAGLPAAFSRHWSLPLVALLLGLGLWAVHTPHPVWTLALCAVWGAAPLWTWAVSRTGFGRQPQACPPQDVPYLTGVARETWRYFERCVTADDHHLPPDNLQTTPSDMLARRTSPTNIGLYLLSVACAREFGWLATPELCHRLQATLATLDRLERYRGHFLNWYDTASCAVLPPAYVSTVDSGNLSGHLLAVAEACRALGRMPQEAEHAVALHSLADRCEALAWAPDYAFLYHPRRHLLHIGFRVAEQQLDSSFYDLLASESRLTSVLAIAKGDVPVRHWAALGRPFFAVRSAAGLRSWSGSMFEYLMPSLVLAEPHGSVLREACLAALVEQRAYAAAHGVPWGISESAYAGCDQTLAYQYAPQGVPRLALRRTAADELVIAPYATALAAQLMPHQAVLNFQALQDRGARGALGFIEALDYTPSRQIAPVLPPPVAAPMADAADRPAARRVGADGSGQPPLMTPVNTFMAHHQGMTLVALANVLLGGAPQRWGMANLHIQAVASLMHERAPRAVSRLHHLPALPLAALQRPAAPRLQRSVLPGAQAIEPTHLLSNGRYSVALRANGAGRSRWGSSDLTRWRDDALRDDGGHFLWLRRAGQAAAVSLSQHPAPDPQADYRAEFHADRVSLQADWPDLHSRVTVWVSPEDDVEFRRVELINTGKAVLEIELISALEPSLADARADESHPAFGKLFVTARASLPERALWFERKPRLSTESGMHAVHFLAEADEAVTGLRCQVDRQQWLGRNRAAWSPRGQLAALDGGPGAAADIARGADGGDHRETPVDHTTDHPGAVPLDTGLDPMCALGAALRLEPGAVVRLTWATAAAADRQTLQAVRDKYTQPSHIDRAALMSATHTSIRLQAMRHGPGTFSALQSLTTALMLTLARPRGALVPLGQAQPIAQDPQPDRPQAMAGARPPSARTPGDAPLLDRRRLWRLGISGDRALILVSAWDLQGLGLVRALSWGLSQWAWAGVACDLVVVCAEPDSYLMPLQRALTALRDQHNADAAALGGASITGWHLLRADAVSADELLTLQALARLRLLADGRSLTHHLDEWALWHETALRERQQVSGVVLPTAAASRTEASLAVGRFAADPAETAADPGTAQAAEAGGFRFNTGSGVRPSRPWINVLANPGFGTQVSEAGGGTTWAVNSRLNQLTPWHNDPVADPPSEWLLLQDLNTLEVWSVVASAHGVPGAVYQVQHGQGHTSVAHEHADLAVEVDWCVDAVTAVKQVRLQLRNRGHRARRLRWIGVCEWMLGAQRSDRATVHTALRQVPLSSGAGVVLMATQQDGSAGFGGGTAFFTGITDQGFTGAWDWTGDRRELFDAQGHPVLPDRFGRRMGSAGDPCAALALPIDLAPGGTAELSLLLGWAASPAAARALAAQAVLVRPAQRLRAAKDAWNELLGSAVVKTPDPLFDAMVNRWLLYQAVACRLWAKAGFYQAGGATGFRDQLQDSLALTWAAPSLLRQQLLRCAAHQFTQGDVLHWWHETAAPPLAAPAADRPPEGQPDDLAPPQGAGVRTHFSDDLLWLPHALAHYLHRTGDVAVLDESVPFIDGPAIPDGAEDIYATPTLSGQSASLYEHAARTLDRSLRVGRHGLPLMGTGDWNDGMNRVGHLGQGESVWLAWFLCRVVDEFAPIAQGRGEVERARRWLSASQGWQRALAGPAWDGQWYARAFFDNGDPLGTHDRSEARIDLIAQAWSVLSGAAPAERQAQALQAVQTHLVDEQAGLIRLLHPPLAHAQPSAGYIQAYPPGVRENGGQYSHAGVWALMAQVAHAKTQADPAPGLDRAWRWFEHLSPAHRMARADQAAAYGAEPYVMAGDVYTAAPWTGRGGWSWYTGAAGWMHRAAIESIFGLDLGAEVLSFSPGLPSHWPRAELTLRRGEHRLHFLLLRCEAQHAKAAAGDWSQGSALQVLLPGELLRWTSQALLTHWVLPLGAAPDPVRSGATGGPAGSRADADPPSPGTPGPMATAV